jgi:hypothetical protein
MSVKCIHILFLLLFTVGPRAQAYDYHPDARLYLGGGFNPQKIDAGYARCLENYTTEFDVQGAATSSILIKYVKSESEIHREVGISTALSGSFLFGSGKMSANYSSENSFQSDSITFIIYANTRYGREYIANVELARSLDGKPYAEILRRCGPEIVTERTLGTSIFGIFTLSNLTESDKQKFDFAVGGGLNGGIFSAQAEASLRSFVSTSASSVRLSMKVLAIGGGGITELINLLPSKDQNIAETIAGAPATIRAYMSTMTKANAIPISFTTMYLDQLTDANIPREADFDNSRLIRAYERYLGVFNTLTRLERIIYDGDPEYATPTPAERERLLGDITLYAKARNRLEIEGRACFGPVASRPQDMIDEIMHDLPVVQWPEKKAPVAPPTPTPTPTPVPTPVPVAPVVKTQAEFELRIMDIMDREYRRTGGTGPRNDTNGRAMVPKFLKNLTFPIIRSMNLEIAAEVQLILDEFGRDALGNPKPS